MKRGIVDSKEGTFPFSHGYAVAFPDATVDTNIKVVATKWGDTGRDIQLALIEDELQANPDIGFIVGNAQAAVSAVSAVREAGLEDQIQILAFHQNPPVYDGIAAGDLTGGRMQAATAVGEGASAGISALQYLG